MGNIYWITRLAIQQLRPIQILLLFLRFKLLPNCPSQLLQFVNSTGDEFSCPVCLEESVKPKCLLSCAHVWGE